MLADSPHEETFDLIEATVEYIMEVEGRLSKSVTFMDSQTGMQQKRLVYCEVMTIGFEFLENLCRGPHRTNQSHMAHSDATTIINRCLQYIDWKAQTPEEREAQIALKQVLLKFMNQMLAGIPHKSVVISLLHMVNWRLWSRQMHALHLQADAADQPDGNLHVIIVPA